MYVQNAEEASDGSPDHFRKPPENVQNPQVAIIHGLKILKHSYNLHIRTAILRYKNRYYHHQNTTQRRVLNALGYHYYRHLNHFRLS